jgi:hypothetical protein
LHRDERKTIALFLSLQAFATMRLLWWYGRVEASRLWKKRFRESLTVVRFFDLPRCTIKYIFSRQNIRKDGH